MTVEFVKDDLFAVDAHVISHGVNCQGMMGAGIAKAFRARYPDMYSEYKRVCDLFHPIPGEYMEWTPNAGPRVMNLFTQFYIGPDATAKALRYSLAGATHASLPGGDEPSQFTFALPLIGCGIGGLTFEEFNDALHKVDGVFGEDVTYLVCFTDDNESLLPTSLRG